MVDRIRYPTVSYLPFYYVFFQFLLLTIFNLQANILTTKDILSNLAVIATTGALFPTEGQINLMFGCNEGTKQPFIRQEMNSKPDFLHSKQHPRPPLQNWSQGILWSRQFWRSSQVFFCQLGLAKTGIRQAICGYKRNFGGLTVLF